MTNYFTNISTIPELKKEYRRLIKLKVRFTASLIFFIIFN